MNSDTFKIIIISGPSGSGKTTLGKHVAQKLNIPFFSKDTLKEIIFDSLESADRTWSKKVGITAINLIDHILEQHLEARQSICIESNFKPEFDRKKLSALFNKYNTQPIEIHCYANETVLLKRFIDRSESGQRHPGHNDDKNYEEAKTRFTNNALHAPLHLGPVIDIDTTDFNNVDYQQIISQLN